MRVDWGWVSLLLFRIQTVAPGTNAWEVQIAFRIRLLGPYAF